MRKNLILLASAIALLPAGAFAAGTATGAAGGAVAGAIVGGPVGAVVGGVIGAVIGTAIEPPPIQVVSYVETVQPPPPVSLQGNLVIGATLPTTVMLYPVPPDVYAGTAGQVYGYAIINGQRVIVDMRTRAVVAITG